MKAAREQFNVSIFDTPWSACGVDPAFAFGIDTPLNSVNASLGWCMEHCGGYQASTTAEWLLPLATWVIPAFTLLLLCSIGENEDWPFGDGKWPLPSLNGLCYWATEYLAIIGDPVSAICGGFSELWVDAWLAKELPKKTRNGGPKEGGEGFKAVMVGLAMVACQTKFKPPTLNPTIIHNTTSGDQENKDIRFEKPAQSMSQEIISQSSESWKAHKRHITTVLRARIDFVNGITLPVVLVLVSTASVFYSAYLTLGDNDTAYGLAFGIWYSWVIVLAVVSNSYVASVNPGLPAAAVRDLLELDKRTLPLRHRMRNTKYWRTWVLENLKKEPSPSFLPYFVGQIFSWIIVAFICACAAAISYNTPTIGIGCRSFSFLLYCSLAGIVALLMMLRDWVARKDKPDKTQTEKFLRFIYAFLVGLNAFVLIFSTIAQLVGLHRSCVCNHFGPLSSLLELSTGSALAIDNAGKTWIPVGFVAYTGVWVVCGVAVSLRYYIASHIKEFLDD